MMTRTQRFILTFPQGLIEEPITYVLVKEYDLKFNILNARITPTEEGKLVLELKGDAENLEKAIAFVKQKGVQIEAISKEITRDDERCIHCGACTAVCPSSALSLDREDYEVKLNKDRCIMCTLCVDACPVNVLKISI
ncbi:MAG: 4Fe-4S dicluster domain-containing protein [Candidatus Eremiobacteraeota bacterium]|nr:4Fe-4S dicluster domain-containing protein [Candidatus Eremiobacteraeota bacterium]